MPAVPAAVPSAPVPVGMMRAGHGDAACFAELRPFRQHAPFDPFRIRNELGAKPHRIGRASLPRFGAALLGSGYVKADKKCAHQ